MTRLRLCDSTCRGATQKPSTTSARPEATVQLHAVLRTCLTREVASNGVPSRSDAQLHTGRLCARRSSTPPWIAVAVGRSLEPLAINHATDMMHSHSTCISHVWAYITTCLRGTCHATLPHWWEAERPAQVALRCCVPQARAIIGECRACPAWSSTMPGALVRVLVHVEDSRLGIAKQVPSQALAAVAWASCVPHGWWQRNSPPHTMNN